MARKKQQGLRMRTMRDVLEEQREMAKAKAKKTPPKTVGRKKGVKPSKVVMFNRYNLMYYVTIKGLNEDGKEVIKGRDYTVHPEHLAELVKSAKRAIDKPTVKLLKAIKKVSYREDVLKHLPQLIIMSDDKDMVAPVGTYYGGDKETWPIVDRDATMGWLEGAVIKAQQQLISMGHTEIAAGLITKWSELSTCNKPPSKSKDPKVMEAEQIAAFSWDD